MEPATQNHHPVLALELPTISAINIQNQKKQSAHQLPGANSLPQYTTDTSTSINSTMTAASRNAIMPTRHEGSPSAVALSGFVLPANFGALNPIGQAYICTRNWEYNYQEHVSEQELFMQRQIFSMLNGSIGREPGLESGIIHQAVPVGATTSATQHPNHLVKMELARECTNGTANSMMTTSSSSQQINASPAPIDNKVATASAAGLLEALSAREKRENT